MWNGYRGYEEWICGLCGMDIGVMWNGYVGYVEWICGLCGMDMWVVWISYFPSISCVYVGV